MRPSSLKYAASMGLIGVLLIALAFASDWLWLKALLGYVAASFVVVSVAYAFRRPSWLGKNEAGHISLVARTFLWPFHTLNRLSLFLFKVRERKPGWCVVQPGLMWGRYLNSQEASQVHADCVLDLTSEFEDCGLLRAKAFACVPMLDGTAPSADSLTLAVEHLEAMAARGATYVHCALGHSRSALVILAYLLKTGKIASIDAGLRELRSLRPRVGLSSGQRALLESYWSATSNSTRTS